MSGLSSLASLEGRWKLSRVIEHAQGTVDYLEGTTTFHRAGQQMIQDEEGLLSQDSVAMPLKATRRYLWSQVRNRLECAFDDGRPFHTVPLGTATPETVFLCPPDRYAVSYMFDSRNSWTATWKVSGPRKDYTMTSTYTRMS